MDGPAIIDMQKCLSDHYFKSNGMIMFYINTRFGEVMGAPLSFLFIPTFVYVFVLFPVLFWKLFCLYPFSGNSSVSIS